MAQQYEYGFLPEDEEYLGLLGNIFSPMRREVLEAPTTEYVDAIDAPMGTQIPVTTEGVYGDPEFGLQYMPAYQAVSGLLGLEADQIVDAAKAAPEALRQMANQQVMSGVDMATGGTGILVDDEGNEFGYDPLAVAAPLAPAGIAARSAGGATLGIFGGKTAKKFPTARSVETSDYESLLGRMAEIEKAREKGMFAYPKDEWENMFGELKQIYTQIDPIEKRIKQQRQGLLDELDQVFEAERTPESAFNLTERKYGTGIFKLPDDQYRFEINDKPAKVIFSPFEKEGLGKVEFSPSAKVTQTEQFGSSPPIEQLSPYWKEKFLYTNSKPLSEIFSHPELYENYPELKNVKVSFSDEESNTLGTFYPQGNRINVNVNSFYSNRGDKPVTFEEFNDKIADVLVHEIQHKVQEIEGFAKGANTIMSPDVLRKAKDKAATDYERTRPAFEEYNSAWDEFKDLSTAKTIKSYEASAQKENIQPRSLFNSSDWYKYGGKIQSDLDKELGFSYNKRKSPQRDKWLKAAFDKMAQYTRQESAASNRLANSLSSKELEKKSKELAKSLDKNRTANLDHRNAMRVIEKLNSPSFSSEGVGEFNVYENVLGEAEARAVQARRGSSKGKQYPVRSFPFDQFEEGGMKSPPPMGLRNTFLLD